MSNDLNEKIYLPVVVHNDADPAKTWLTKDRRWNFVFWFGTSLLMTLALELKMHCTNSAVCQIMHTTPPIALIILPVVFMLSLCKYFNGTHTMTKNRKHIFFSNNNQVIEQKKLPTFWLIILTVIGWIVTGIIMDSFDPSPKLLFDNPLLVFILCTIIFSVFSLYFIIKNCPISILLNRNIWHFKPGVNLRSHADYSTTRYSEHSSNSTNHFTDPSYKFLPGNIYYKR